MLEYMSEKVIHQKEVMKKAIPHLIPLVVQQIQEDGPLGAVWVPVYILLNKIIYQFLKLDEYRHVKFAAAFDRFVIYFFRHISGCSCVTGNSEYPITAKPNGKFRRRSLHQRMSFFK